MLRMNRKQFLSVLAATAALPLVGACGGGDDDGSDSSDGAGGDCLADGTQVVIASNHAHVVTVSAADVEAGAQKTYMLSCVGHSHEMTLTADHFASLQGGTMVAVQTTSGGGHTHSVTVRCA